MAMAAKALSEDLSIRDQSRSTWNGTHSSLGSFWSKQITRAREAVRARHGDTQFALARTLLAAYEHGLDSGYLNESLILLRDLHAFGSENARGEMMVCFGEALLACHERTGHVDLVEELLRTHQSPFPPSSYQVVLYCHQAKALLFRAAATGNNADITHAKTAIDSAALLLGGTFSSDHATASAMYHVILWRMNVQYSLPDLTCLGDALIDELEMCPGPLWRCELLAACFSICSIICYVTRSVHEVYRAFIVAERTLQSRWQQSQPMPCIFSVSYALSDFCMVQDSKREKALYMTSSVELLIEQMFLAAGDNAVYLSEAHHARGNWLYYSALRMFRSGDCAWTMHEAAVQYHTALRLCPARHINRHRYVAQIVSNETIYYEQTGARRTLIDAIALCEVHHDIAVQYPPLAFNTATAIMLRVSAGRLQLRSAQTLLHRAVYVLQIALSHTPDNRYRQFLLQQLNAVYLKHGKLGLGVDHDEHLSVAQASVAAFRDQPGTSHMPKYYMAQLLADTARRTRDAKALQKSMDILEQLSHSVVNEIWMLDIESTQASCYMIRHALTGASQDLEVAEQMFRVSCADRSRSLTRRLDSAITWAECAGFAGRPVSQMRAYDQTMRILPLLAYLGQDVGTRVEAVQLAEGLACRASALALLLNNAAGAVESLEQGRGVVWSQSLRLKSSLHSVPSQYADAFAASTQALGKAIRAEERQMLAIQLDTLTNKIREVEGYERFLLPRLYSDLRACASHGIVVLVIPSDTFTDVITIASAVSDPVHLHLPALKLSRLQELTAELKRSSDRARNSTLMDWRMALKKVGVSSAETMLEHEYYTVLKELWVQLVHPMIISLGVERCSIEAPRARSRLWWCPAGPFAELPLHAAGIYKGINQDCVSNYVVSSYTPTLTALINAQEEHIGPTRHESASVLLVSLPEVSGLPALPNARVEADLVREATAAAKITTLCDDAASIAGVLGRLPSVSVLHLACHAHQSQDDPLASGFSLHDGRLTLERLMQLHLPHAELAYLSACETASTDQYQPDEAINLAATMLFVGFKSIIATMWSMNDLDGPFVAQRVYKTVFREGNLDLSAVPYAVDAAVRELRESGVHPSRWATYVHIGA